jgi:Substrate binding domain of ABC-type glycine betaine transport system
LLADLKTTLAQQNIALLGELGFENAHALVMPKKRAEALDIHSIADLAVHAGTLSMAADYEFFSRPEWAALQKAYGLSFRAQRQMQPDFMYAAVASDEVDVIAGYTSDALIAKYDLVCCRIRSRRSRLMMRSCCWRRNARTIRCCVGRCSRCWGGSTLPRCARPICARLGATARVRRTRWRGGCGRGLGGGRTYAGHSYL